MCGICGVIGAGPRPLGQAVRAMNDAQAHRGPDGEGIYMDRAPSPAALNYPTVCALGHRRLAIIDPAGGAQPMLSDDGRMAAMLNGEIYNFRELRAELKREGCHFRTDSDTEVLIHLYRRDPEHPARWLARLNGIFAIAIWDREQKRLLLARDHYGVKPLHYAQQGDRFLFASEIKALLAAGVRPRLNRAALHVFMNIRYVPGNETLFEGVHRLPPAHFAWVSEGRLSEPQRFYSLPTAGVSACHSRDEAREAVAATFDRAVERQLVSDVPVGMALSGGLDSSMIVAAASRAYREGADLRTADRTLRTFTLGFNEPTDENDDARLVADYFGTEHHDTLLESNPLAQAADVIRAVEEPKVNMIQGYNLAQFVKPHVKVLFGGLGGDELFAGYDIHRFCNTLGRMHHWTPRALQRGLLGPAGRLLWQIQSRSGALRTEHYRIGAQIALSAGDRAQFYCRLRNAWDYDAGMYERLYADPDAFRSLPRTGSYFESMFSGTGSYLEDVLRVEFQTKMVNDFLVNEDRVTSAHGVEGRVPFLDRDLVELAFQLPGHWKMKGRETKTLWKDSVGDVLPNEIRQKKKQGFTFSSYHQWEKDLRSVVQQELTPEWCEATGLFNHSFVASLLDYPPHATLRWHYFTAWMMLGVKQWMDVFDVEL
ncbi:MAG: asparagine synthase (glutamine-hydrolyzing) [Kiritimatiellia bacterium]|nr:asparagine synthase (glutamine-hydrolyzing) [Kiritimatiellia bacterium]